MMSADGPGPAVVLGGSGFVGSWITVALAAERPSVRAVSRRPFVARPAAEIGGGHARPPTAGHPVAAVAADLCQAGAVAAACRDAALIVVVVTDRTSESWRVGDGPGPRQVTVGIPEAVIEFARSADEAPAVVLAGTITQSPRRGAADAYEELKQEAEDVVLGAAGRGEVRATSLRLPTVYGPRRSTTGTDHGVVSTVVRRALEQQPIAMWHDGSPARDLLYVADAAEAFVAAAGKIEALNGRPWEIGLGQATTVGELFEAISVGVARATGRPGVPIERREPPDYAVPGDTRDAVSDPEPFRARTGWAARTPWPTGLLYTIEDAKASMRSGLAKT